MAVAKDKPIKQGCLLVPPLLKKKWQKKFCVLYSFSNNGIERLEIYDNEDDATKRTGGKLISLENCIKISLDPQKNHPFAFSIITKHSTHLFACGSSEDSLEWVCACQGVAFRDSFSSATIEEDNELYCPSGDAGIFHVILVNTETSQRCGLAPGDYTLVVAPEELQLRNPDTQNLLFTWPYRFIRRYGHKRGRFNFEAGRKCASGEGSFDLEHSNAQEIFKCITSKMDSMKQRLGSSGGGATDKSGTTRSVISSSVGSMSFLSPGGSPEVGLPSVVNTPMDVDEGLAVLMTMSARSRSPLVSLSSSMTPISVPLASRSPLVSLSSSMTPISVPLASRSPLVSLSSSMTPISVSTVVPSLAPMKPPRKNPPLPRYDQVEVRTDAWRPLGTPEIALPSSAPVPERPPHSGNPFPSTAIFLRHPPNALKDFTHSDYDKLDHFGSTPKLDEDPSYSTIYRQDTQGYGIIRKVSSPRHEVYNDFEYAMVVKTHQASHKV